MRINEATYEKLKTPLKVNANLNATYRVFGPCFEIFDISAYFK